VRGLISSFSWSTSVVEIKSDKEPLSTRARAGCPLILIVMINGLGIRRVGSFGLELFCSNFVSDVICCPGETIDFSLTPAENNPGKFMASSDDIDDLLEGIE